ncbi:MAG: 2'-deoxycytidine 5'-triphosphate deaminase [Alphaproteobacteria bacterium CG_4_10_14_0_8_um_filter_53_9]|nr:MAG: 2'-deoxycytidine 5'-triphosphate deaminase [Alphaproteobacteria bacterium CG_4_10_14_0_8_um_filter_53_9]
MTGEVQQGVLVDFQLKDLIATGEISLAPDAADWTEGQVQPASLDLRLGTKAYRLQATVLPGQGVEVMQRAESLIMGEMDLTQPQLLERGGVYLVPLMETLSLHKGLAATASPKSSTGRLDIFVRLVTDGCTTYDTVVHGYKGQLFVEVCPLTFPILARAGDRLNQIRFRRGDVRVSDADMVLRHEETPLIYLEDGTPMRDAKMEQGLWTSIDLGGSLPGNPVVGYKAKYHTQPVDLARVGGYGWEKFWEPIYKNDCAPLILYPESFYIFASRERICVPPDVSAELVAYDTRIGEIRVHYAGFFDPGFGFSAGAKGTTAVLEVRAHDVPCVLEHGQVIGRFVYEKLAGTPEKLYGAEIASNYAGQGLKLAKQFLMEK